MDETFKKALETKINVNKTKVLVCERENSTIVQEYR